MQGHSRTIRIRRYALGAGIFCNIAALGYYYRGGFSGGVALLWIASLALTAVSFFYARRARERLFTWRDLIPLGILGVIFVPLYLINLSVIPWQIGTDEIATMAFERQLASAPLTTDWFGLSGYFHYPNAMLISRGILGRALGGVTLATMRLVSAGGGMLIILASYFFFRLFFKPLLSFVGGILVGSHHALLALSRMAMNSNGALLHEIIALTLLVRGYKKSSRFETFFGGAIAGLAFYHYFPGRIIIFIWALFLLCALVGYRKKIPARHTLMQGVIALLGFMMAVGPLAIATIRAPGDPSRYAEHQILLFPEARELERTWVGAKTVREGMLINIKQGLTVFNNNLHDFGYEYLNPGHGFVDPVTGILVWIGFIFILFRLRKTPESALILVGFSFIFLFFAFLTTKNPNFTRFLIVIPFAGALVLESIRQGTQVLNRFSRYAGGGLAIIVALVIALVNLGIYGDYVQKGFTAGNDIGGTARYVEARHDINAYTFYLLADKNHPYYSWGETSQWQTWLGFFVPPHQTAKIIPPDSFLSETLHPPFTLFTSHEVWSAIESAMRSRYPYLTIANILPDGSRIAVEVRSL